MRMALAAAALTLAVGCAGNDGGSGVASLSGGDGARPSATPSASADPEEAARQFAKCMREHGVDMPDPGGDGGMVVVAPTAAPRRVQEAERACGHLLQAGLGEPPAMDPEMQDRAVKFARCMREHGIDLPDPGDDGAIRKRVGDGGGDVEAPFRPDDPKFKKAHAACGHLFQLEIANGGAP